MPKTQFCGYICGIMITYKKILIILDNFEINFIGALFPAGTAVAGVDTLLPAKGKLSSGVKFGTICDQEAVDR